MYPADRKYSKDHEWILIEGDLGKAGITDYAQKQLGDVVELSITVFVTVQRKEDTKDVRIVVVDDRGAGARR